VVGVGSVGRYGTVPNAGNHVVHIGWLLQTCRSRIVTAVGQTSVVPLPTACTASIAWQFDGIRTVGV
jgi:hypothetical protein